MMVNELVTKEDFNELKTMLKRIIDVLPTTNIGNKKEVLTSKEVKQLLQCSDSTLTNYRTNGILPFTKIQGRYYYSQDALNKLFSSKKGGNNE